MTVTPLRPVEDVASVLRQADRWARACGAPGSPEYLDYLAAAIRSRVIEPMIAAQPVELAQLTDDNARLADELARLQHALQRQTLTAEGLAGQLAQARAANPNPLPHNTIGDS